MRERGRETERETRDNYQYVFHHLRKLDSPSELMRPSGGVMLLFISLFGAFSFWDGAGVGVEEDADDSGKESSATPFSSSASASVTYIKN